MLSSNWRALVAVFAIALPAAADVLTVGPPGSGAQFAQIQAAIDAAADDDVILVKPGSYQAIALDKSVRILADGTGTVRVPTVAIANTAAGGETVLSGVTIDVHPAVRLSDCAGTVVLEDIHISGDEEGPGVRIQNCQRALLLGSRIISAGRPGPSRTGAVVAQDSELWLANTEILGSGDCCFSTSGAHGIELVNSTLHAWRSRIRGGTGAAKQDGSYADGGTAIKAVGSTVNLLGGPTSEVSGGSGYEEFLFGDQNYPGGPGLDLAQFSQARIQAGLPLRGGFDGRGEVRAPAIVEDGTSSHTFDPKVFPTLVASAQQVQLGSSFTVTAEGNPGGYQVLFLSLRTGPTSTPRGVDGFGLLDRTNLFKVASEVLPGAGTTTVPVNVPSTTALLGATLFFQAAERFPSSSAIGHALPVNRFALGNPVLVTITR